MILLFGLPTLSEESVSSLFHHSRRFCERFSRRLTQILSRFSKNILPVLFPPLLPVASITLTGNVQVPAFISPKASPSILSFRLLANPRPEISIPIPIPSTECATYIHIRWNFPFRPSLYKLPFKKFFPPASVYTVVCLSIERLLHLQRPQWSDKVHLEFSTNITAAALTVDS